MSLVAAVALVCGVSPGAHAETPTPVPAPLVDLDAEPAPTAGSTPSTATERPEPTPQVTPEATIDDWGDTLGGAKLGQPRGIVVDRSGGAQALPDVKAKTWVLADATTGAVLAAKKAHKQRRPASTLKTLTALTLLPKLDPEATWIGTPKAANTYGSKAGIRAGREYTVRELFYGLLLPSGNDAAIALAQVNSTVPKTVAEMNDLADQLQANNTVARNTSGLDAKGQLSTAYDLALIARAALEREDFRQYVGAKTADFPNPKKKRKKPITVYNQNDLIMDNYRGAIGVKTGYTSKAGRTFIGAAERGGKTLIVTLMGISEPSDEAARKLLNWGFRNRDRIVPVGELVPPLTDEVVTAEEQVPTAQATSQQLADTSTMPPTQEVGAATEQTFASLSPAGWGWLGVFGVAAALLIATGLRRFAGRRRRQAV